MFSIGEYAVCPGHGVGQICDIEEKEMGTQMMTFYVIKILANGMKVMVPTDSETGIRGLVGDEEVGEVYKLLTDHDVKVDNSTWNRRYREYSAKIKTGSVVEIAEVLRQLFLLKEKKALSFGEKKMLDQCRELLAQEISLTNKIDKHAINEKINSYFQ
ncbi:MAG: CarD family transcriptional regulator [Bacteriovorax sp.]|jgi:CarD family transcriptional regulator|nr:CarD family transcriptional regulator [Bacteriovorax sp.]